MRRFHAEGALSIDTPRGPSALAAHGSDVVLSAPSLSVVAAWWRLPMSGGSTSRRRAVAAYDGALRSAGVSFVVRVGDRVIARLGRGTRGSLLTRLLGFGRIDLRLRDLVLAAAATRGSLARAVSPGSPDRRTGVRNRRSGRKDQWR